MVKNIADFTTPLSQMSKREIILELEHLWKSGEFGDTEQQPVIPALLKRLFQLNHKNRRGRI
jgi:hypothetical protein